MSRWAIAPVIDELVVLETRAIALVFTHNFDRNPFDFFSVKPSPMDFNNKAPGRAAHPGFGGGLSMNAEGVRQTALL